MVLAVFPGTRHPSEQVNVGEFGDKFRKAREKKELSFDDVSNVIKISARMLRAIEEEDFDQLPGGVFNKGFIRAYAKQLGLDDEEAVVDYLAFIRQAEIEASKALEPKPRPAAQPRFRTLARGRQLLTHKHPEKSQAQVDVEDLPHLQLPRAEHVVSRKEFSLKSSREIPWSIIAIAIVVLTLAAILWTRHSRHSEAGKTGPTVAISGTNFSEPKAAPIVPSTHPANPQPATAATTQTHTSAQNSPQITPSSRPSTAAPTPSGSSANRASSAVPVADQQAKPAASFTLVIRATETSWVSVQADGETVREETLIAPAHIAVSGKQEIVVKIGNAAGVAFVWNGREIPAEGAEAEVRTVIFDANGMRVLPATGPTVR